MDEVVGSGEIVGPQPPPIRSWQVVAFVAYAGLLGWFVVQPDHDFFLIIYPLVIVWTRFRKSRPPTFVSTAGIVRPWRNRRFIRWEEVESVARPTAGVYGVRLKLLGGKTLLLDDIPAAQSGAVAAIGGKELVAAIPIGPSAAPREVVRGDVEIEADVRRQAAALAEHRRQMKAQSDALHWKPGP